MPSALHLSSSQNKLTSFTMRIYTLISREENEALRKELRDIRSRLSEDYCKTNVRKIKSHHLTSLCSPFQGMREDSIVRNFGIMNSFFMSMNDDCEDRPEEMLHPQDPWLKSSSPGVTKVC